jgi:probable O-glycosylation ligase (exosortase A-associated)
MAVMPELTFAPLNLYSRIILMSLLIVVLVQTFEHLRLLILVMAGSLGFIGFKFGLFGMRGGGVQFSEGYAGFIGDSNGLALAMVMTIPLCWYAIPLVKTRWAKASFALGTLFSIATVVLTFSRGCALGLVAVLILIALRSKRKVGILVVLAFFTAPAIYLVYDRYVARMKTISTYESEDSAASRVDFAKAALSMSKDYPAFGVGFGSDNYTILAPKYLGYNSGRVVHNTYLQMLVDSGVFAFAIYLAMLFGSILWLSFSVRRTRREAPHLLPYPLAMQTSLIGFAVGSTFYSRIQFEPMYMVIMATAVWYMLSKDLSREAETQDESLVQMTASSGIGMVWPPNVGIPRVSAPQPVNRSADVPGPVKRSDQPRLSPPDQKPR